MNFIYLLKKKKKKIYNKIKGFRIIKTLKFFQLYFSKTIIITTKLNVIIIIIKIVIVIVVIITTTIN